jgi:putative peptide zinc metalloprotease protein
VTEVACSGAAPSEQAPLNPPSVPAAPPRLARGVELLGPYRSSGLKNAPYLVRRGDTILQISQLLHTVAFGADGRRNFDEIAALASARLDRRLSPDDVRYLIEEKLAPAGIVAAEGEAGDRPPPPPAADDRLLALRFRRALVPPELVNIAARFLAGLYRRPVVVGILVAVVAFDAWLFGVHGIKGPLNQVLREPELLLFVAVLTLLSTAFHEFGHAAACRYSGARPGAVGAGVYLIWPVLYTNVTDAYRLGRIGRLRTDLGGLYFNAVFVAVLGGAYVATGFEPLLAVVVTEHFTMLDQLTPWVRFDGYYILSDLTGVPDILNRVRPALQSLIPGRPQPPEILALRPRARRMLYAYLGSFVFFIAIALVTTVVQGPRLLATSWHSLLAQAEPLRDAIGMWDLPVTVLILVQTAMLAAPFVGLALFLGLLVSRYSYRRASIGVRAAARRAG